VTSNWRKHTSALSKRDGILLSGKTVTTPLVLELTTGLFLKTLLKVGYTLDNADQQNCLIQSPERPDIMNPDCPTNIDFDRPVDGYPGYFVRVFLDGEKYEVSNIRPF
jgi:hypothetical protein